LGGFLSLSYPEAGELLGYDLLDLTDNRSFPFIRKGGKIEWERIGPFFFIPDTLRRARSLILEDEHSRICFVDEVGPLELKGKGIWPALAQVQRRSTPRFLFSVRTSVLGRLLDKLENEVGEIFSQTDSQVYSNMNAHYMHCFPS